MSNLIPIAKPSLGPKELELVCEAMTSGWISSTGCFVEQFEEICAAYIGVQHGIATANGSVAIQLALAGLGIGPSDEVIVPNFTFAATINAVIHVGATPILADIDPDSWTIDANQVEKLITKNTKAVVPVHIYGQPCCMTILTKLAVDYDLYVVEDFAEAFGAKYRNEMVGSLGDVGCTSFFANKIVTTGEGGMCFTDDTELAEEMRTLRDHGMSNTKKYWHIRAGYNFRLTNLQAAIGCAQMERIDNKIALRAKIEASYVRLLGESPLLTFQTHFEDREKVCWLFTILINQPVSKTPDQIVEELLKVGIESRPVFIPLNLMPPYQIFSHETLTHSQNLWRRGISLPTFEDISIDNIERVGNELLALL